MDIPVYKLYLVNPSLEAMRLPPEKGQELVAFAEQSLADVGAKSLLTADIFSDEIYTLLGVEWFPSLQAVIEHNRCLREVNWFQLGTCEIFLGADWHLPGFENNPQPYQPVEGAPAPIYKAFILRFREKEMPPEAQEKQKQVHAYMQELGVVSLLGGLASLEFNESWTGWGLERYPSHEALQKTTQAQWDADWWKSMRSRTYLATATGGLLSGLK